MTNWLILVDLVNMHLILDELSHLAILDCSGQERLKWVDGTMPELEDVEFVVLFFYTVT